MRMRFVWDPAKAESNQRKHGVRFEDAVLVFFDPLHLTVQDRVCLLYTSDAADE